MRRLLPIVAIVLVANTAMLVSAWRNRATPRAVITLTERELPLRMSTEGDSARRFGLSTMPAWFHEDSQWLSMERIAALGFDCGRAKSEVPDPWPPCGLPRRALVVYEFDGPSWERLMKRRREPLPTGDRIAPSLLERFEVSDSRLVPVDAGLDAAELYARYSDSTRYLIVAAKVSITLSAISPGPARERRFMATAVPLVTEILAPQSARDALAKYAPIYKEPRYRVRLAVGQHHEPWIVAVEPIDTSTAPH